MSRRDIHYWKCDRPAAFHGTEVRSAADATIAARLGEELKRHFSTDAVNLSPGVGQGNHLTWNAEVDGRAMFVRVENGPEKDDHLAVESELLDRVRAAGVRTPLVHGCDATRARVAFAWVALERIDAPDLNQWYKKGVLDQPRIAFEIGEAIAKWQTIRLLGYGVLDAALKGYRGSYEDYFRLRLGQHLSFLVERQFLTAEQRHEIEQVINEHAALLQMDQGCLVHKDLALWNILGTATEIAAFIDFDDAISGDPMDDFSLLGCFHDAAFLERALAGYQSLRPLPEEHRRRFWLHLLRNMIVKAVIRVGAGYFQRDGGFFLIGAGASGSDLRKFTHARIDLALAGLKSDAEIGNLL